MTQFSADALRAIAGPASVLTGSDIEPFITDWRGAFRGEAQAVVRPASAEEVAAIVLKHPRVRDVRVRVEKLDIVAGAVGVEIVRGR